MNLARHITIDTKMFTVVYHYTTMIPLLQSFSISTLLSFTLNMYLSLLNEVLYKHIYLEEKGISLQKIQERTLLVSLIEQNKD